MPIPIVDPKAALDQKRATLEAIPTDQVKTPAYPPYHLIGEANALYEAAGMHRARLIAVRLDPALIDDLPLRAQALAGAQSARSLVPDVKRSAEEVAAEEQATQLRSELHAAGRYATYANPEAQSALDKISEGTGHDDLIQDLKDLSLFCEKYATEMKAIGIALPEQSHKALQLASQFEKLLAERRVTSDAQRQATDLRNRAATHLFHAMAAIRAAGAFAFRNDPAVLPLFRSTYRRRRRGGSGSSGNTPVES